MSGAMSRVPRSKRRIFLWRSWNFGLFGGAIYDDSLQRCGQSVFIGPPGFRRWALLSPGVASSWREGLPASLFFRPEYVEFFDRNNPSNNGTNTGTGIIERVTFLGNSADVVIRCGEIALCVRAHPTRTPAAGKQVYFSVAPESCIVFPASSPSGMLTPSPQSSPVERIKTLVSD